MNSSNILIESGCNLNKSLEPGHILNSPNFIQEALIWAEKVTLSSIPPREDDRVNIERLDEINEHYSNIANTNSNVTFVKHDKNFEYQESSADTSMLLTGDLLHLSAKGTQKLIDNLGLGDVAIPTIGNRWSHSQRDISGPSSVNESKHMRPPHQTFQIWPNAHVQSGPGNPPLRSWPGIKYLPHLKKKRFFRCETDPLSNFFYWICIYGTDFSRV